MGAGGVWSGLGGLGGGSFHYLPGPLGAGRSRVFIDESWNWLEMEQGVMEILAFFGFIAFGLWVQRLFRHLGY